SARTVTDVDDLYRRLAVWSAHVEELGVTTESHTVRMLQRIAPGEDLTPLTTLLAAVTPVDLGGRMDVDPATQLTPLTALSDAARPDPPLAHELTLLVRGLGADSAGAARERLAWIFQDWKDAAPGVAELAGHDPLARDGVVLSQELAGLGTIGMESLA